MLAPFRLVTTFSSTMITCILEQLYPFQLWFGGVSQKFYSFPALTGGTKGWHNSDRCSTCNDSVRHFRFRRCASKGAKKGSLKYRFSDTVFLPIIFYEEKSSTAINCFKNMSGANIPKKLSNFVKLLVNLWCFWCFSPRWRRLGSAFEAKTGDAWCFWCWSWSSWWRSADGGGGAGDGGLRRPLCHACTTVLLSSGGGRGGDLNGFLVSLWRREK